MAILTTPQELLPLLGSVVTAEDPLAALERKGHSFSPALKSSLQPRRVPTATERAQWTKAARMSGPVTFTAGKTTQAAARELATGEYEFTAGIRMGVANEILAGTLANGTLPDTLFLDELLSAGSIDLFMGAFRMDRPGGRIGRMLFTAPPVLAVVGEGSDRVAVTFPFRLLFERISRTAGRTIRTVVTQATGRLRLIVGLTTQVATVRAGERRLEMQIDLSQSLDARLDIDPGSPVQRVSQPAPGEVDGLAVLIQNALQQQLAERLRVSISAQIPMPIGRLEIHETAMLTRGDALLVGVKVQGTPAPGNPETLVAHFPNAATNFFTRLHDQVLRIAVRSAARSGELTAMARRTHPDAQISSADVAFGKDTISLMATGKVVDMCPFGVDMGFTMTTTLRFTLEGTRIKVTKETSIDLDNADVALCLLTSLGTALLAAIGVLTMQGFLAALGTFSVIGVLTLLLEFDVPDLLSRLLEESKNEPIYVELDAPLPGTDLLPTLTGPLVRLDESTMLLLARLGTRPDDVNTYFYVRFMEADELGIARAMRGVGVTMMDRDSPAPAGDDVVLPAPTTRTTAHQTPNGVIATTTRTTYERTRDEAVRTGTTDYSGRVRMYIPWDGLATRGGVKVEEIRRWNVDTDDEEGPGAMRRTNVREARPDFYFKVTRGNGSVVDTLQIPSGFFLNFQSARVGSFAAPLTIAFGGGRPVVLEPVMG